MDYKEKETIIEELKTGLNATFDGPRRNLIVPVCPWCGKQGGKMGIYVGPDTAKKRAFMAHCFKCGNTTADLASLLRLIGREDLMPSQTISLGKLEADDPFEAPEIDDLLEETEMPKGWKRCFRNPYLDKRGLTLDDYDMFPVGTTRGLNFKYDDYVLFRIEDEGRCVGHIGRHTWTKEAIDSHNRNVRLTGGYELRRYTNSRENNFSKLLYNYDSVVAGETDTVIITEGVLDCIALTRKLNLYDDRSIAVVATFGKKISDVQIYKLKSKGVRDVILGYDSDATAAIIKTSQFLSDYFDVLVARIACEDGKDWDEMSVDEVIDTFANNLYTPREYNMCTL